MNKFTRTAVGALAAAAVVASISPSAPAQAAPGKDWTTVESHNGARQQACKVSVNDGTAWRIFNRLDARRVTAGRVGSSLTATRNGDLVPARSWESGWVRHGNVSDVGTFKIPKGDRWAMIMTIYGEQSGDGGELSAAGIGRC